MNEVQEKLQALEVQEKLQVLSDTVCQTPQREPAKFRLRRVIDQLRRESEEAHLKAVQLQALFNELPEQLSPQAYAALDDLLNLSHKRY